MTGNASVTETAAHGDSTGWRLSGKIAASLGRAGWPQQLLSRRAG